MHYPLEPQLLVGQYWLVRHLHFWLLVQKLLRKRAKSLAEGEGDTRYTKDFSVRDGIPRPKSCWMSHDSSLIFAFGIWPQAKTLTFPHLLRELFSLERSFFSFFFSFFFFLFFIEKEAIRPGSWVRWYTHFREHDSVTQWQYIVT